MKKNPGWKLDLEVIELVQEARAALGLQGNADVIAKWAKEWKASGVVVTAIGSGDPVAALVAPEAVAVVVGEKPMAARVETPYQIARREKLDLLRAQLEAGGDAGIPDPVSELSKPGAADPLTLPFNVLVNGERHRVIEFKGRRVLQRLVDCGPPIMMKNLTPQETVIYWNERTK